MQAGVAQFKVISQRNRRAEDTFEKPQSGFSVSRSRFEPGTFESKSEVSSILSSRSSDCWVYISSPNKRSLSKNTTF
jgi:hypothetical protein